MLYGNETRSLYVVCFTVLLEIMKLKNAILANFCSLDLRTDIGARCVQLWIPSIESPGGTS